MDYYISMNINCDILAIIIGYVDKRSVMVLYGTSRKFKKVVIDDVKFLFDLDKKVPKNKEVYYKYSITLNNLNNLQNFSLVNNLTHLSLGDSFNQSVDELPLGLKYLSLGNAFNQSVDNLPSGLKYLSLGDSFNQSVNNLPSGLTHLSLGDSFNKYINKLPSGLTHLSLGDSFNKSIDKLPLNLLELYLGLIFDKTINNLPKSLRKMHFSPGSYFNNSVDKLPSGLTHLILGYNFMKSINCLPNGILHLSLGWKYGYHMTSRKIEQKLPDNIEVLSVGEHIDLNIFTNLHHHLINRRLVIKSSYSRVRINCFGWKNVNIL